LLFRRVGQGWRHSKTIIRALIDPAQRKLLRRMVGFSLSLPQQFKQPLPLMMARLTPVPQTRSGQNSNHSQPISPDQIRQLADAVAAWHLFSPLGICLRRSLLRYHFLWEAGVPVRIVFGARFKDANEGGGLGGHAWLTLDDIPYYENPANYQGFTVMYTYPVDGS
jgi:hypothetical protein